MSEDRDLRAISSWERMPEGDDPGRQKGHVRPALYACLECCWHRHGVDAALKHRAETGHDVKNEYRPAHVR